MVIDIMFSHTLKSPFSSLQFEGSTKNTHIELLENTSRKLYGSGDHRERTGMFERLLRGKKMIFILFSSHITILFFAVRRLHKNTKSNPRLDLSCNRMGKEATERERERVSPCMKIQLYGAINRQPCKTRQHNTAVGGGRLQQSKEWKREKIERM
jgi:hypothetical protein